MPAYKENIKILLTSDGDVPNTLLHTSRISNDYSLQVLEESVELEANTDRETAKNIWQFVRENVAYKEDSKDGETEILRRPGRSLADMKGDCDCANILISAILKNLDIPHYYKVVAYENVGAWQHIYPVVIDRQTGKHIAIDFVPEVPSPLFELPYIDATAFDSETGKEKPQILNMNTYELGCATRQPLIYDILPPPPQIDFDGETTGECQAVEHTKVLTALQYIKDATGAIPSNYPNAYIAQKENEIVRAILESPEVPDLKESFKNAIADKSDFSPIYATALKSLEETESNPTAEISIKQSLNGALAGSFPVGEALSLVGTITGSYLSMQALDKQNAQSEYNLGLQLQNTTAQIEGQQKLLALQAQEAEKQRQFEMAKLAQVGVLQQNQNQQKTPTVAPQPIDTPPPTTTKKWYEQQWVMYAGGGLILLILGLVFYFFTKKKKKVLNGTGKKRRQSTQRKRRTSLAGATKLHTRKRNASPKMPKMKMPKSKPRIRAKTRTKARTKTTTKKKTTKPKSKRTTNRTRK